MSHLYPFTSPPGKYFYQYADNIGIYPTPTESKTIRMHYVRSPLTITTSVAPEIKSVYHELLSQYAILQIIKRINPEAYVLYMLEFEIDKDKLLSGNKNFREEIIKTPHKGV